MPRSRNRRGKRRGSRPDSGGGLWFSTFKERLAFELGGKAEFPGLRSSVHRSHTGYAYTIEVEVEVPGYGTRNLRIVFNRRHFFWPAVFADGPTDSKHRYGDGSLCMWYPDDGPAQQWIRSDGLSALIGYAIRHLFYEGWWRETGHWIGPEAPHGPVTPKPAPEDRFDRREG